MNESVERVTNYFIFVIEVAFIFFIGLLYAFIQPEELWVKLIFLLIAFGWVVYIIKSIWDFIEKKNVNNGQTTEVEVEIEQPEEFKK